MRVGYDFRLTTDVGDGEIGEVFRHQFSLDIEDGETPFTVIVSALESRMVKAMRPIIRAAVERAIRSMQTRD